MEFIFSSQRDELSEISAFFINYWPVLGGVSLARQF